MHVHVVATGGTIASTDREGGATPTLDGKALLADVPDIEAEITVESIASKPGFDMDPTTIADIGDRARAVADDVSGVVVTHGTDTMEESAYYLDLTLQDIPVVFTGAQRRPDEVSADGPANLRTAVRAAAHERVTDGVYLAFDEELHAARTVTKAHTAALDTFTSPEAGPVARFTRDDVHWHCEPRSETVTLPVAQTDATVPIVYSGSGADASQFERSVAAGADGVVVAATGLGNVTSALGEAVQVADLPVVVASRCFAGPTEPVYGTPGGGQSLAAGGALFAGALPPWKARLKLALALAAVAAPGDVDQYF